MSWIEEHEHRMTQGERGEVAVDPVQRLRAYLRSESLNHHAKGLNATGKIQKERCFAAHHGLENARAWMEANL